MARTKQRFRTEETIAKIKTAWLIKRLQDHINGKLELSLSQVRAIGILLKKVVPDLTATEITGDVTHHYVVELPPTLELDEWKRRYSPTALLTDQADKIQ
jgi:monomeric isocitrate dehydrogenase